jgi:hypothetical protein
VTSTEHAPPEITSILGLVLALGAAALLALA